MAPIQQIIISLQPKKKYSLFEYIPDFESYNDDVNINDDYTQLLALNETNDNDIQGSLSEKLYNEIDGQTTRMYFFFNKLFYLFYYYQVDQLLSLNHILRKKKKKILTIVN
jgi:hypothetical protein